MKYHTFKPGKIGNRECAGCGLLEQYEHKFPDCGGGASLAKKKQRKPKSHKGKGGKYVPCHKSHLPLELKDGLRIYGASCSQPVIGDANVYIGFEKSGMTQSDRRFPWNHGEEILFPIVDRNVPEDEVQFRKLVEWTIERLYEGDTVHAGCIGGHGRTGMFLAAVVALMELDPEPIAYVRENYCKKAVESKAQVAYLVKHFGCEEAKPSKGDIGLGSNTHQGSLLNWKTEKGQSPGVKKVSYLKGQGNHIWGEVFPD